MAVSNSRSLVLGLLLAVALVAAPQTARGAMTCSQVYSDLIPCLPYMQYGPPVPTGCCDGIKQLVAAAATTADRRAVCGCIKNAAAGISSGSMDRASSLPGKCGVNMPYKISPSTNCAKIN